MLDPEGIDVLVLAGDICVDRQIIDVMQAICKRYEQADVVWVHGNHEFYGSDRPSVLFKTQEALKQNKNFHWLDCDAKVIRGQRFIGAPLWFVDSDQNKDLEGYMNDFHVIKDLRSWVYNENKRAVAFIEKNAREDDVVITHHLPTHLSVAPRFAGGDLNRFFVCDVMNFIRADGPKLWIHGHTHDSFDYIIPHAEAGKTTRVICNPRGYWPDDLNPDFQIGKVVEI